MAPVDAIRPRRPREQAVSAHSKAGISLDLDALGAATLMRARSRPWKRAPVMRVGRRVIVIAVPDGARCANCRVSENNRIAIRVGVVGIAGGGIAVERPRGSAGCFADDVAIMPAQSERTKTV